MSAPGSGTLSGHFLRLAKAAVKRVVAMEAHDESPIRAELFSIEQIRMHAGVIAETHKLTTISGRDRLLRRLKKNEIILTGTYEKIHEALAADFHISPAAEWLLDNFYLIEDQIHLARRHLPKHYSRQLPRLAAGRMAGFPRVYHIVLELIAHLDGRIDAESLNTFISSYQLTHELRLGELWAVPIMIRLALIENLRRVAARIAVGQEHRNLAAQWARRLLSAAETQPGDLIMVLADMARSNPPLSTTFVAEFSRCLQGKNPALSLSLTWIEQRLSGQSRSVEEFVQDETQKQAADQVSIANSIASLRLLSSIDWHEFVENASVVDKALRQDPAGVYDKMDFATRDQYRHAVESIAKYSRLTEHQIAQQAVGLAAQRAEPAGSSQSPTNMSHVGYYLVHKGRPVLEKQLNARPPIKKRVLRCVYRWPLFFYLFPILLLTAAGVELLLSYAAFHNVLDWKLVLLAVLLIVCISQPALMIVNWAAALLAEPRRMPRMDFSRGVPPEYKTVVVIPTMLTGERGVLDILESLEVRYIANRDENIHFALLTDFCDAPQQTAPDDQTLLRIVRQGVERLNKKYGTNQHDIFFLFHRPRLFNSREKIWMGRERKRGKLADFNALLRHGRTEQFSEIVGDVGVLRLAKFVITLDTDTDLPRDAACQLVATMAHPLIRARHDPKSGKITDGYSILQPRVEIALPSTLQSRFVRMFTDDPGVDPYTHLVSDLYQDLFEQGSYIGKGIYDVEAFEAVLGGLFPDNRILSHDLLEGCYARAGLVSDILLYEDHPAHYLADVKRRHRWIRGDWQIAQWLMPYVPGPEDRQFRNPLSRLSRWKILDNLRRSLFAPALLIFLALSWFGLPGPGLWTLLALGMVFIPPLLAIFVELISKPKDHSMRIHLQSFGRRTLYRLMRIVFSIAFLPFDALVSVDAVCRTIFRVLISRRRLLEWQTYNAVQDGLRHDLGSFYVAMFFGPALAVLMALPLLFTRPMALVPASALLVLWLASPLMAWWISKPPRIHKVKLATEQENLLRITARRTWRFFETLMGPDDNYLPPDNFQEYPAPVTAHRTSPTNIGIGLLGILGAYDFGYITGGELAERASKTFQTMLKMERYHGHFYNWYDTQSLKPLPPNYISSVDSGNLAAMLLVLRQGFLEQPDNPILPARVFSGLGDVILTILDLFRKKPQKRTGMENISRQLQSLLDETHHPPHTLRTSYQLLERIAKNVEQIFQEVSSEIDDELRWAFDVLLRQSRGFHDELAELAPWCAIAGPTRDLPWHIPSFLPEHQNRAQEVFKKLQKIPTLREIAEIRNTLLPAIDALLAQNSGKTEFTSWLTQVRSELTGAVERARQRWVLFMDLAENCDELVQMDFEFLFDKSRDQLAIGYNVTDRRRDPGYYDLLASEARLGCYVGIALGQLPQESWFSLSRRLSVSGGQPALVSWSGSMFEYLMPLLVMPTYPSTLLDATYQAIVKRQIQYGRRNGVYWGISESGYNLTDRQLNYQYRAFGVPGLGIQQGLDEDLVIAPYASVMALMVAPEAAAENLHHMAADGLMGRFGYFEAVDYTPSRMPAGQKRVVIRSFMAHHQGMSLLSLVYLLLGRPMQRRFLANPQFKAIELLLHERVPKVAPIDRRTAKIERPEQHEAAAPAPIRVFDSPNTPTPEIHLLSNGRYHSMITNAGSGYNRWKDLAVTRWRTDPTRDCWGNFLYIRDVASGAFWSAGFQPALKPGSNVQIKFHQGRAEFDRTDAEIHTRMEISVSPEDDVELRRIRLTNHSGSNRTIELTSYAEVVLAPQSADAAHPAFSNLFVNTRIIRERHAILCTRRARAASEKPPWMIHLMTIQGQLNGGTSFETDRNSFIGRGCTPHAPAALMHDDLSNSQGPVLDPIVSIRRNVTLKPDETAEICVITGVAETQTAAEALIDKYQDTHIPERVLEMAWTHSQVGLQQLNISETDAQLFGRIADCIIYPSSLHRSDSAVLTRNRRGQSGLWSYGISGDVPIVLVRISDQTSIDLIRKMAQAHAYWRLKGLVVDLVIWNEDRSGYRQVLQDQIMGLIGASAEAAMLDRPGGIFVRRGEQISDEDRILFQTVASVIVSDTDGELADQINRRRLPELNLPRLVTSRRRSASQSSPAPKPQKLIFDNGFGGFSPDGTEYIITTSANLPTPVPWVNVLANPEFGTVISESSSVYTWAHNAHEYRLTPWFNDPVSGAAGEAFYIRDEDSGLFWSPTPLPARGVTAYTTRHGFGYSVFQHVENAIESELTYFVAVDASVKFAVLRLTNRSDRSRRISATGYWEWVLAEMRDKSLMHVVTELDSRTGALLARNHYNTAFAGLISFVDVNEPTRSVTADRTEFLGRNGELAAPAAMRRSQLGGRLGAGLDPCAVLQVAMELEPGQQHELVFTLGTGRSLDEVHSLIQRCRGSIGARNALEKVHNHWNDVLGAVQVQTPDAPVNILANGWLVYQTLSARIWGRTGFYQSGGAFGFRDQLQDAMALVHARPQLLREHLLRCAAHQFQEGDVQHWWHPPSDHGVRTRCSDDFLWLPLAACHYVAATSDTGVLDEQIGFLDGRPLNNGEESYYDLPGRAGVSGTLYDHCVRAVKNGLKFGDHGLPLMGSGDWNDGMNLVGHEGRGESVWLAFFLHEVLTQFAGLARRRGDSAFAELCAMQARQLADNIESHAWDGRWYRRAYFDDGSPLGSMENPECQIDLLPQSWAVISGVGDSQRCQQAMTAVDQHLVDSDARLIRLLIPPFDQSPLNPGYIKGYVPGIRENGGQYTHAAVWTIMAFALMGNHNRAWELFCMINPINHGVNKDAIAVYKVEPYVVVADIYASEPHPGRGGWTWYTGSAGWMYRFLIETLLGVTREGNQLHVNPRIPDAWNGFKLSYRYQQTIYNLTVKKTDAEDLSITLDGSRVQNHSVPLVNDKKTHEVRVDLPLHKPASHELPVSV
ncbi:MAG TPA: glucoamylase family protein [Phycisphaerae bacterium]|nr:glucoamylase family protein [Phycisphaerae bacterium]